MDRKMNVEEALVMLQPMSEAESDGGKLTDTFDEGDITEGGSDKGEVNDP